MPSFPKSFVRAVLFILFSLPVLAQAVVSDQNYIVIPGYFDSDSNLDILEISKDASHEHLFYKGIGSGQYQLADQSTWANGLFGIPWSGGDEHAFPGYFTPDADTDLLLQGASASQAHSVVSAAYEGQLSLFYDKQWSNGEFNLNWDAGSVNILTGEFAAQSGAETDVLLQNKTDGGNHSLVLTTTAPLDDFLRSFGDTDGLVDPNTGLLVPGLSWNNKTSAIYTGDFNGDGYTDIFIQAKRGIVLIPTDDGLLIPVQTNQTPVNAILINDGNGNFTVQQTWGADYQGLDWFAEDSKPIIGDFNGDGHDDILLQSRDSTQPSAIMLSDVTGQFSAIDETLSDGTAGVNWSQDSSSIQIVPRRYGQTTTLGHPDALFIVGQSGTMQVATVDSTTGQVSTVTTQTLSGSPTPPVEVAHMSGTTVLGKVAGSFNVNPNGSAGYSIPIAVPPGLSGMKPALALNYTSGTGDGVMGVGWSLSGLSAISRCPDTYAQDGQRSGVNLDNNDKLCLDGQRLVAVDGTTYGQDGAHYRTESDSFSLIIQHGALGAPAWFEVKTKAGQTFQYGATDDSRYNIQNSPTISWSVNQITDAAGNYLTVKYNKDTTEGSQYPDAIHYTMNNVSGSYDTHNWVKFRYEDRPDVQSGYVDGYKYTRSKRLAEINTYFATTEPQAGDSGFIKDYQILYQTSQVNNESLVSSVKLCAGDGSCVPATKFRWSTSTLAEYQWSSSPITTGICNDTMCNDNNSTYTDVRFPDLNGDGRSDICTLDNSDQNVSCALTNADGSVGALTVWYTLRCGSQECRNTIKFADMNGDGKADLVYRDDVDRDAGIQIAYSNGASGFGNAINTGILSVNSFPNLATISDLDTAPYAEATEQFYFYLADINGDGLTDICAYEFNNGAGGITCHDNTLQGSTAFSATPISLLPSTSSSCYWGIGGLVNCNPDQTFLLDMNRDGKADVVYRADSGINVQFTNGDNVATDVCANGSSAYGQCNDSDNFPTIQLADVTGDGIPDLCFRSDAGIRCMPGTGTGFDTSAQDMITTDLCRNGGTNDPGDLLLGGCTGSDNIYSIRFIDLNGDGKADLVYRSDAGMRAWLSTGHGFVPFQHSIWNSDILSNSYGTGSDWNNQNTDAFADFNGDGVPDFTYRDDNGGIEIYLSQASIQTTSPNFIDQITDGFNNQTTVTYAQLTDANVYTKGTNCSYPEVCVTGPIYVVHQYTASNGVGGAGLYSYHYSDLRANLLGRGLLGFAQFTKYDNQSHIRTVITNEQTGYGTVTVPSTGITYGDAVYPTLGMPLEKTTYYDDGTTFKTLSDTAYTNSYFTTDGTAYFPYFASSTTNKYDFDTGANVTTTTTTNSFDTSVDPDSHLAGDITEVAVNTVDHINNLTFSKVTDSTYYNNLDPSVWQLGRVTDTKVTHSGYGNTQVRESSFQYYQVTAPTSATDPQGNTYWQFPGMLESTQEEPTSSVKTDYLQTTYYYDQFGDKQKVDVAGYTGVPLGLQHRYSTTEYDLSTIGQRNQTINSYNQLGQHASKVVDSDFGVTLSHTGPNNITTNWSYDSFGRVTQEDRADGTSTTTNQGFCSGTCPKMSNNIAPTYWVTTHASGSAPVTAFYDQLGRKLRTQTSDVNNNLIDQDNVYDANGRLQQSSIPYFDGGTALWNVVKYDAIGRVQEKDAPSGTKITYGYASLTTTSTVTRHSNLNSTDQNLVTTKDYYADGKIRMVTDPNGGQTVYKYDAVGNLIETDAPSSSGFVKTTMQYDQKGRKISMTDPDMGTWHYTYDSFGKLIEQVDGKGQTVVMVYDQLDRMVLRIEPESINRWVYDDNLSGDATGAHIGKLMLMAGPIPITADQYAAYLTATPDPATVAIDPNTVYQRGYTYDTKGRPISVTTTIPNANDPASPITFQVDRNYDTYSRVSQVIYPQNVGGSQFSVSYTYDDNTGTLLNVKGSNGTVYWKLGDSNGTGSALSPRGQVQAETYGNGISTYRVYDQATGLVQSINTSVTSLQSDAYVFDSLGNLEKREDDTQIVNNVPVNEVFQYDTLNRLSAASLNGVQSQTFQYDASGNITYNSRFGWHYHYDGSTGGGPHAVAYTTDDSGAVVNTYNYDANGNLISGAGRGIGYASYNLPTNIATNTAMDTFYYGADHTRYEQQLNQNGVNTKTIYYLRPEAHVGAHFERHIENGVTTDINYIYAGGGLVATHHVRLNTDGTVNTFDQYYYRDHLGSTEVITDAQGNIKERLSYTAFGERRPSDWSLPDAATLIAAQFTDYGFTGQEHMDEIGLIHMNGRVYDPKLGRFLSADPNIQAPQNSQSFNRYSYVMNNPLSMTDPTGFFGIGDLLTPIYHGMDAVGNFLDHTVMPYVPIIIAAVTAYVGGIEVAGYSTEAMGASAAAFYGPVITGAANGAIFNGTVAAEYGGNIGKAALTGAVSGAMFADINTKYGDKWTFDRVMAESTAGGFSSVIQGGDFEDGFRGMFWSSMSSWVYYREVGWQADPRRGATVSGETVYNPYKFPSGPNGENVSGVNTIQGLRFKDISDMSFDANDAKWLMSNLKPAWYEQGGSFTTIFINDVSGGAAVSHIHDFWGNSMSPSLFNYLNYPLMVPAAAITYAALSPPSLTVYLSDAQVRRRLGD